MLSAAAISPERRAGSAADPRAAGAALIVTIAALLLLPADLRLLLVALALAGLALLARQLRRLLRRLRLVLPMIAVFCAFIALRMADGTTLYSFAGLELTRGGLQAATALGARLLLLASASLLFVLSIPLQQLTAALAALRLPARVIAVLWLTERVLVLLGDDLRRSLEALRVRAGTLSRAARMRAAARIGGTFLLRAVARSERLADAMAARGFQGRVPVLRSLRWRSHDTALCAGSILFFTALWMVR